MAKRGAKNATALRSVQVKRKTSNRDASAHRSVKGSAAQKANLASDSRMVSSKKLEKKTAKTEKAEKGKAQKSNTKKHTLKKQGTRTKLAETRKKTAAVNGKDARNAGKTNQELVVLEQVPEWNVVDVAEGIAVHDSRFTRVHYLNHTAAAIYLLCKEPISFSTINTILREEFGLKRDPKTDILSTIEEMIRIGLIRNTSMRG